MRRLRLSALIPTLLLLLLGAVGAAFVQVRWLGPRAPDASEWFPMRPGDRWTYADQRGGGHIVFEVVGRAERGGVPAFVVERRIGRETLTFILSVARNGVWIHETTKGVFDPPFMEFRLPPRVGDRWEHVGKFGDQPVSFEMAVSRVGPDEYDVREKSRTVTSTTDFRLKRGVGVTQLDGKSYDAHSEGPPRYQEWKLREFHRR